MDGKPTKKLAFSWRSCFPYNLGTCDGGLPNEESSISRGRREGVISSLFPKKFIQHARK
jgi:hypothetical protein